MPGLNRSLRTLKDGTVVPSIDLAHWDGVKHHVGRVWVFWPFVVLADVRFGDYNITHAPTGRWVNQVKTLTKARNWIAQVKKADWEFWSPKSRKRRAVKAAVGHLLPRFDRVG